MADLVQANEIMYRSFEPKLKNRFLMEADGIPAFMVKATGRPSITFDEVVLEHMNTKRFVKGKGTWNEISMTLYDPIVPSAAQSVMDWIRLSHESVTGRDGYSDFYKKETTLRVLGPVGDVVEQWTLKGSWIKEANFGDLDFGTSEAVEISLTLRYDYAVLEF